MGARIRKGPPPKAVVPTDRPDDLPLPHRPKEFSTGRFLAVGRLVLVHAVLVGFPLSGAAGAEPGQPGPPVRLAQAAAAGPTTLRGTVIALDGARLRVATAAGEQDVTLIEGHAG